MDKKNLCIIPARGGSKRIPRKNIKPFLGKPIIAYSIEVAIKSQLFDEVMVSTDDKEIAEIAKNYGAIVPFMRSDEAADDYATTMDVLQEVIKEYTNRGRYFNYICCIYPTAPMVKVEKLKEGFQLLKSGELKSVLPVTPFEYPIWRGLRRDRNGSTELLWPENQDKRSQDMEPIFHDAGQWYWLSKEMIGKSIFGEHTGSIVIDGSQVQDIDTDDDWQAAEMKYKILVGEEV